jgi:hypothetical protein
MEPRPNGTTALATRPETSVMDEVIAKGNLADLSPDERARYYLEVCQSIGLNPLTKPFDYLSLSGKLVLYATKTATDQLRTLRGVSIVRIDAETVGDLRIVQAFARDASGREDMDIGVVNVKGLAGEFLANSYMKALTKAKRRVTLSICGLGWMDDSEIDAIPGAQRVSVDVETGEIIESIPSPATPAQLGAGESDPPSAADADTPVSWTEFWKEAKRAGIGTWDAFEKAIGPKPAGDGALAESFRMLREKVRGEQVAA